MNPGLWYADDMARQEAREQDLIAAGQEDAVEWLGKEWLPRLNRHRDDLRDFREDAARRDREALEAAAAAEVWEAEAMAREDARSKKFLVHVSAQCKRRDARWSSMLDGTEHAIVRGAIFRKEQEMRYTSHRESVQRHVEEHLRKREAARKEREYLEWKDQVRSKRCHRRYLEQRDAPMLESDVLEKQRLELQGRDYFREREMQQMAVLQDALKRESENRRRLEDDGLSPKHVLENARMLANKQREERISRTTDPVSSLLECGSVTSEAELWETLLAKNRLARQQERLKNNTPRRWGVLNDNA